MKKPLVITGSHPDVVADMLAVPCREIECDLMAIGLDAVDKYIWPILYVATYHPEDIAEIRKHRESAGGNIDYKIIGHEARPEIDIVIKDWWKPSGSSTLLGVQAAIQVLGYDRIILCGCPLTGKSAKGNGYESFRNGWEPRRGMLTDRVRSMSGWTAELLGKPTEEWIHG